jgi:uncharacterized iron-regulated membrane protein
VPSARANRAWLKSLHIWIGIPAGLFISIIGLTGSVIVLRSYFERAAMPRGSFVSPQSVHPGSIDLAAREVARLRPDAAIRRVKLPVTPGDPFIFQVEAPEVKAEHVVAEAATGRVTGTLNVAWLEWLVDLHHNLLTGKSGRKAVGFVGMSLFLLSATGLLLWVLGPRSWRSWITVRPDPPRRFQFELHRAAGLWSYVFLAVISFTGIELAFPDTFKAAMRSLTGEITPMKQPRAPKSKTKSKTVHAFSEYLAAAQIAMPDGAAVEMRLAGKGPIEIRMHRAGDLEMAGNHVMVDPGSSAVLLVERLADRPAGTRFLAAFTPIHYAQIGGTPVQLLWSVLGAIPALLFITGLLTWWRPPARRRKPAAPEMQPEESAVAI